MGMWILACGVAVAALVAAAGLLAWRSVGGLLEANSRAHRTARHMAETLAKLACERPLLVIDQSNPDMALPYKATTLGGKQQAADTRRAAGGRRVPLAEPVPGPDEDGVVHLTEPIAGT